MSLTNMKTILTSLLLFIVIAHCSTASAQLSEGRLWSPVRSDQFGGNSRLRDGVFGEISYNYWLITKGKDSIIGWDAGAGNQNLCYTGSSFQQRKNTMTTASLGQDFHSGITARIGRMNGHHGWELKTTIMEAQRAGYQGTNGEMDISDGMLLDLIPPDTHACAYVDQTSVGQYFTLFQYTPGGTPTNVAGGYLWGWFQISRAQLGSQGTQMTGDYGYGAAPLPLTFDHYKIDTKLNHWDVEANYIYRTHATRIGFFEFTGGVRYMQLDDNMGFTGWGMPWHGNVRISMQDPTPSYAGDTSSGGSSSGSSSDDTSTDVTAFYLREGVLPDSNKAYTYEGTIQGPGTVLTDSKWHFEAQNHIVGPQVGLRYIRKVGRWSLIADTKFFAGFNAQNVKSYGQIGSQQVNYDRELLTQVGNNPPEDALLRGQDFIPWVPLGFQHNGKEFNHSKTFTEFTPGIDFSLKANWQWTDAIGFNVGYQGMFLDNTARATNVNDYKIDSSGNIFAIRDNVSQATWIHGLSAAIVINRF